MPTTEEIEQAATNLRTLLDQLPASPWREPAQNHLDAVLTFARLGVDAQDAAAPSGEPESTEH